MMVDIIIWSILLACAFVVVGFSAFAIFSVLSSDFKGDK